MSRLLSVRATTLLFLVLGTTTVWAQTYQAPKHFYSQWDTYNSDNYGTGYQCFFYWKSGWYHDNGWKHPSYKRYEVYWFESYPECYFFYDRFAHPDDRWKYRCASPNSTSGDKWDTTGTGHAPDVSDNDPFDDTSPPVPGNNSEYIPKPPCPPVFCRSWNSGGGGTGTEP